MYLCFFISKLRHMTDSHLTEQMDENTKKIHEIMIEIEENPTIGIKITPGEAKRIELIRKMKQDTDKKEYMVMFNVLMIGVALISFVHFVLINSLISLIFMVVSIGYFIFTRKRLTAETLKLAEYKNNFDRYLWEGFHLKEMRYYAVKIAYFIFFPLLAVLFADLLRIEDERVSFWIGMAVALILSTIAWSIYFSDDEEMLRSIESDLKALEYL